MAGSILFLARKPLARTIRILSGDGESSISHSSLSAEFEYPGRLCTEIVRESRQMNRCGTTGSHKFQLLRISEQRDGMEIGRVFQHKGVARPIRQDSVECVVLGRKESFQPSFPGLRLGCQLCDVVGCTEFAVVIRRRYLALAPLSGCF